MHYNIPSQNCYLFIFILFKWSYNSGFFPLPFLRFTYISPSSLLVSPTSLNEKNRTDKVVKTDVRINQRRCSCSFHRIRWIALGQRTCLADVPPFQRICIRFSHFVQNSIINPVCSAVNHRFMTPKFKKDFRFLDSHLCGGLRVYICVRRCASSVCNLDYGSISDRISPENSAPTECHFGETTADERLCDFSLRSHNV